MTMEGNKNKNKQRRQWYCAVYLSEQKTNQYCMTSINSFWSYARVVIRERDF